MTKTNEAENGEDGARTEIRKIIAENAEFVSANIYAMINRHVEDLAAGGVDYTRVADATLYVGLCHQQQILGTGKLIDVLRDLADLYERRLHNPQKSGRPN